MEKMDANYWGLMAWGSSTKMDLVGSCGSFESVVQYVLYFYQM